MFGNTCLKAFLNNYVLPPPFPYLDFKNQSCITWMANVTVSDIFPLLCIDEKRGSEKSTFVQIRHFSYFLICLIWRSRGPRSRCGCPFREPKTPTCYSDWTPLITVSEESLSRKKVQGEDGEGEDEGGHLAREIRHPALLCGGNWINVGIEEGIVEAEEVVDVVLGLGEGGGVFHQEKQEQDGESKPLPLKAHHRIGSLLTVDHQPCKFVVMLIASFQQLSMVSISTDTRSWCLTPGFYWLVLRIFCLKFWEIAELERRWRLE